MAKKIYTIFASLFLAVLFFNLVPGKAMASITAIFDIIPDPGIVNQDVKIKVLADAKDANSGISTIDIFIDNYLIITSYKFSNISLQCILIFNLIIKFK